MHRWRGKRGFTLVEIMIVVAIMGLLVAIAVPNFIKARQQAREKICKNNLRLIYHALEQYKIDYKLSEGVDANPVYDGVIVGSATAYIREEPTCPIGNLPYNVTTFDDKPSCPNRDSDPNDPDYAGHVL